MIISYLESHKKLPAITDNDKTISYNILINKVFSLCEKINKLGSTNKKVFALDLDDNLEFIVCYLACLELGLNFFSLGRYYNNQEKKDLINFVKPNFVIKKNSILRIRKKESSLNKFGIFFTSGTTSQPKGIIHCHKNFIDNAIAFNRLNKLYRGNFLQIFPMSYMAGFLNSTLCPLLAGSRIVISQKIPKYNLINFWNYINKYKITYTWVSPSVIKFLNETKSLNYKKNKFLKRVFVGTAPFHSHEKKNFNSNFNIYPLESYGSTEMLLVSCNINKNKGAGKILDRIKIRLKKKNEILINSPFRFNGTLKKNGEIEKNMKQYFLSGDIGYLNKDYLILTDRKKDIIIKDGINISPKYVENKIISINGIDEVAIVGKKDQKTLNERIICFIKKNKKASEKIIEKKIYKILSKIHTPDKILFLEKILKNKVGKIDKKELIKIYDNWT